MWVLSERVVTHRAFYYRQYRIHRSPNLWAFAQVMELMQIIYQKNSVLILAQQIKLKSQKNEHIDAVFIATRHNTHAELTMNALKQQKHVFVEKPLALNRAELAEITKTYRGLSEKPMLMVGFNRRYSKLSQRLKERFQTIHEPLLINYRVNAGFIPKDHWIQNDVEGGGRIIGEVCHFIDYAKFLAGARIESVYARCIQSQNQNVTNEDTVIITLTFSNGSIAVITYLANGDKSISKERIEVTAGNIYGILDDFKALHLTENGKTKTTKLMDKGQKNCARLFLESTKSGEALISADDLFEVNRHFIRCS